jgi:hypothetical protein
MTIRGKEKKWPRSQFVTSTHCHFCIISWVYFNIHYQFVITHFYRVTNWGSKSWVEMRNSNLWKRLRWSLLQLQWSLLKTIVAILSMIMRTTINVYCMHVFMCMNGTLPIHGYIMHDHLYKVNRSLSILGRPYFGQKYSMFEPYMLDMYGLQVHVCPILDIVV